MYIPFDQLSPDSRVWVYTASHNLRALKDDIEAQLVNFVNDWTSHQQELWAWAGILHGQFVCLAVDNRVNQASGCSIDKSVAFLRQIENRYHTSLLDGRLLAAWINNTVQVYALPDFRTAYKNGILSDDTLVFDTLVERKMDLDTQFIKPLSQSWHKRLVVR